MKPKILPKKIAFFLAVLFLLSFSSIVLGEQTAEFPHKCRTKTRQISRKEIVADIEKYRKGETPVIESKGELISCLEAFPVLKKYIFDRDPNIRDLLTEFLGYFLFSNRLPLFLKQIEMYPLKTNALRYASYYPCRQYRRIKSKALTNALIKRIKSLKNDAADDEIYILGCAAPQNARAKQFLEELRQNSFQSGLTADERRSQLRNVDYALAEAADAGAEKSVLADFEGVLKNETETLEFLLGDLRGFTNCRILLPVSRLILDERNAPESYLQNKEIKLRIGDLAVSVFQTLLEKNAVPKATIERIPRTLEERNEIYRQVQAKLKSSPLCRTR